MTEDARANGPRRVLGLGRGEPDRHHHVALDPQHRALRRLAHPLAPEPLVAEVAGVADDDGGIARQIEGDGVRRAAANDEGDAALAEARPDLAQALEHEGVVTGVRLRVVVHQAEADDDGELAVVGDADGQLQGRVEARPLRLLHPVEDVGAVPLGPVVQPADAFRLDHHRLSPRSRRSSPPSARPRGGGWRRPRRWLCAPGCEAAWSSAGSAQSAACGGRGSPSRGW